jgi:hypothetical protein
MTPMSNREDTEVLYRSFIGLQVALIYFAGYSNFLPRFSLASS